MQEFAGTKPRSVKASLPPFNKKTQKASYPNLVELDVPCFGLAIVDATMTIFQGKEMEDLSNALGVAIPDRRLDSFVKTKVHKIGKLVDEAKKRPDSCTGGNPGAINRLERFIQDFRTLDEATISGPEKWNEFIAEYVVPEHRDDWQNHLHFDHLLGLFGFEAQTATELQQQQVEDDGKMVSLEQHSLRWVSKALSAYRVQGTLADVVNLIYAMLQKDKPDSDKEENIAKGIEEFGNKLRQKDWNGLWVPDCLVHDAELDDTLSWLLLKYVHQCRGANEKPRVLAQLPPDIGAEELARIQAKFEGLKVATFVDPESKNGKNVKDIFKAK